MECDSTLYVGGMMQKQSGGPIPPIHYSFAKYYILRMTIIHIWAIGLYLFVYIIVIKLDGRK